MSKFQLTAQRNKEMLHKYKKGRPADKIAKEYGLSEHTVLDIIYKTNTYKKLSFKDPLLDAAMEVQNAIAGFENIRIGDVLRVWHDLDTTTIKSRTVFTGTVIYKDDRIVSVKGDHYTESFQLFDLISGLVEHIPV